MLNEIELKNTHNLIKLSANSGVIPSKRNSDFDIDVESLNTDKCYDVTNEENSFGKKSTTTYDRDQTIFSQ